MFTTFCKQYKWPVKRETNFPLFFLYFIICQHKINAWYNNPYLIPFINYRSEYEKVIQYKWYKINTNLEYKVARFHISDVYPLAVNVGIVSVITSWTQPLQQQTVVLRHMAQIFEHYSLTLSDLHCCHSPHNSWSSLAWIAEGGLPRSNFSSQRPLLPINQT